MDVVDSTPLADGDPLWDVPRLLITPKVSVFHPDRQRRLEEFIEQQVARFIAGEQPRHVVAHKTLVESILDDQLYQRMSQTTEIS